MAANRSRSASERSEAIKHLGGLTANDAGIVRDLNLVDALLAISKNRDEDRFLRTDAVEALGELQLRVTPGDGSIKDRYAEGFTKALKDVEEHPQVRAAIARIFRRTLKLGRLPDDAAYDALLDLAEDGDTRMASRNVPLKLRVEAVRALGVLGSPKCLKTLIGIVLARDIHAVLLENAVKALGDLVQQLENVKELDPNAIRRLTEMAAGPEREKLPVELRAVALKTLARVQVKGGKVQESVVAAIKENLTEKSEAPLVIAGVEALGLLGDAACLDALAKAFVDFYNPAKPDFANDVAIRASIMTTLGNMLRGAGRKLDAAALKTSAGILAQAVDPQAQRKEVDTVIQAAAFNLRYLPTSAKEPSAEIQTALEKLVARLRESREQKKDVARTVMETLDALTGMPFEDDAKRWIMWYQDSSKPAPAHP
ncbi:MAG: hypothetical protein HY291_17035 [Planctomycetes bacterium]|nr:hypothetical protein [Planctomycetota bacterium]